MESGTGNSGKEETHGGEVSAGESDQESERRVEAVQVSTPPVPAERYLPRYVEKPWGWENIWAQTDKYVGKILHIEAGKRLSLQYHEKKDETIRILSGRLELETRDEGRKVFRSLVEGEVFHITPGMQHRMLAVTTCEVLEVSTPELDDVIRVEDDYNRITT